MTESPKPCYGVYRVLKSGALRYLPRSATHSKRLAEDLAAERTRGEITLPTGAIKPVRAFPHVARLIGDDSDLPSPDNTFRKHMAAIEGGTVTKTEVIGLRKALNADERRRLGYSVSATAPRAFTDSQWESIMEGLAEHKPRVAIRRERSNAGKP